MTAPVPTDFPDYGRYLAQANKIYTIQVGIVINAITTFGPFFVGDQTNIVYRLSTATGKLSLFVEYYDSASMTTLIGRHVIDVDITGGFRQSLPVLGPFMRLLLSPVATPHTLTLLVWSVAGPVMPFFDTSTDGILIARDPINIAGGGGVQDVFANQVWVGQAYWSVFSASTTWNARLQSVNAASTTGLIDYIDKTDPHAMRPVFLPACITRMHIQNFQAGAADFIISLVGRMFIPGA
jgi:hypothetical protein